MIKDVMKPGKEKSWKENESMKSRRKKKIVNRIHTKRPVLCYG
jgi:hypothetical protein